MIKWDMKGRLLGSLGFLVMVALKQPLFRPF